MLTLTLMALAFIAPLATMYAVYARATARQARRWAAEDRLDDLLHADDKAAMLSALDADLHSAFAEHGYPLSRDVMDEIFTRHIGNTAD